MESSLFLDNILNIAKSVQMLKGIRLKPKNKKLVLYVMRRIMVSLPVKPKWNYDRRIFYRLNFHQSDAMKISIAIIGVSLL